MSRDTALDHARKVADSLRELPDPLRPKTVDPMEGMEPAERLETLKARFASNPCVLRDEVLRRIGVTPPCDIASGESGEGGR